MRKIILLSLAIYLLFFIALAPARLLPWSMSFFSTSSPPLVLRQVSGTLWNGRANAGLLSISGGTLQTGQVNWQLSPWSLLWLTPAIHLNTEAPGYSAELDFSVSLGGYMELDNVRATFPLSLLEPWMPLLVGGEANVAIDHVAIENVDDSDSQLAALAGALLLKNIQWQGGDYPMPLGDYTADMSLDEAGGVAIVVADRDARLAANGDVKIQSAGSYYIDIRLAAKQGLAAEVSNSLNWLGKKNDAGEIVVSQQGRWR